MQSPLVTPRPYPLIVSPQGRLGNRMFQYMLADQLQRRLGPRAVVYGPGMPEWGWLPSTLPPSTQGALVLRGHLFDLDEIAHCVRAGLCESLLIQGWGMRVEYYPRVEDCRPLFRSSVTGRPVAGDEVLINIRTEDIESGEHAGYFPLPFDFYEAVIQAEGKRPVFVGQLQPSPYVEALRRRFPDARYLPLASPLEDFQTIRNAACVVPAVSSFAWLATWLSTSAQTIHLAVAGLFDPRRGRQNLLPVGDERYRFWDVDFPLMRERPGLHAATWAAAPRKVESVGKAWAIGVARESLTKRLPANMIVPVSGGTANGNGA